MKIKKDFNKRLVLKKKTIANLDDKELQKVYGGITQVDCISYTNCRTDCVTNCLLC
jgi:bacteriocin-like protein